MNIDVLISESLKSGDSARLGVLRLIKSELLKAEKSGREYDEVKILLKMVDQRGESIRQYKAAGRLDLVEKEEGEIKIIREFLPVLPTDEELREYTQEVIKSYTSAGKTLTMKEMKPILSEVQKKYPSASGKIVSEEVKKAML